MKYIDCELIRKTAIIPHQATPGSSGFDLFFDGPKGKKTIIEPGKIAKLATGIRFFIPKQYEGQIRSRSGNAFHNGLFVLNSPGTIDADYRGEIFVLLANFSEESVAISHGYAIAQIVFCEVPFVVLRAPKVCFPTACCTKACFPKVCCETSFKTKRGCNGFGSTGRLKEKKCQ